MDKAYGIVRKFGNFLAIIAGVAVTFMMLLTVADVTGRAFGYPIMGTYEVVALALGLVIGCAMPYVSLNRQHVYMDFVVESLPRRKKALLKTFTRLLNIGLFLLIGYALFWVGGEYRASGEVSPTILLPFYPMAFLVGLCCLVQCAVYLIEIAMVWRATHE